MDRRSIAVSGIVQGVGFRPFVYDLATRLGLHGFVRNRTGDVLIEVEGESRSLDRFLAELTTRPPPLARIDEVRWAPRSPRGDPHFRIEASEVDPAGPIFISPDVATCDDCLRGAVRPAGPPVSVSLPQLHQLRPPADDHPRGPVRPRAHDHGVVRHVPRVPRGVRGPARPPVPRPADRLPVVRPAVAGPRRSRAGGRGRRPPGVCGRGAEAGGDRRPQGPGGLPPRLPRRRRPGGGGAATPQASRREAAGRHGARTSAAARRALRGRRGRGSAAHLAAPPHRPAATAARGPVADGGGAAATPASA